MPSQKKLRSRRPASPPHAENDALSPPLATSHGCCHHSPPLHSANGHHHCHDSLPSNDEKISNLLQLNTTLVKQVSSLRAAELERTASITSLEELLHSSRSSKDALLVERDCLEDQKRKLELEVASLKAEAAGLVLEKTDLLAEKQAMILDKDRLESALSDLSAKELEIKEHLEVERKAAASAHDGFQVLNSEAERLRVDNQKLNCENDTLKTRNCHFQSEIKHLQLGKERLQGELVSLRDACAAAQLQASNAQTVIEAMQAEVASRNEAAAKLERQLEAERKATVLAQNAVQVLKVEVERQRLDNNKLIGKNYALESGNTGLQSEIKYLQSKEKALEEELANLLNTCASAELQVANAKKVIEALQSEVSKRDEAVASLERQLDTSLQRIGILEAQVAARIEKQNELESQIRGLEKDLCAAQNAHESASAAVQEERQAKQSLTSMLEASRSKGRDLEEQLDSVKFLLSELQTNAIKDQESISTLQNKLSCLMDEKKAFEETKSDLEKKVSLLNSRSAQASLKAKAETSKLTEQIQQLELALSDAKDEASQRDRSVRRLESDLQRAKFSMEEKSKLVRMALPVAVMSTGTLIFVGMLSYIRGWKEN